MHRSAARAHSRKPRPSIHVPPSGGASSCAVHRILTPARFARRRKRYHLASPWSRATDYAEEIAKSSRRSSESGRRRMCGPPVRRAASADVPHVLHLDTESGEGPVIQLEIRIDGRLGNWRFEASSSASTSIRSPDVNKPRNGLRTGDVLDEVASPPTTSRPRRPIQAPRSPGVCVDTSFAGTSSGRGDREGTWHSRRHARRRTPQLSLRVFTGLPAVVVGDHRSRIVPPRPSSPGSPRNVFDILTSYTRGACAELRVEAADRIDDFAQNSHVRPVHHAGRNEPVWRDLDRCLDVLDADSRVSRIV